MALAVALAEGSAMAEATAEGSAITAAATEDSTIRPVNQPVIVAVIPAALISSSDSGYSCVIRVKVFEQRKHKVFKTEGIRNGIPCKNGENMANSTQIFNYVSFSTSSGAMLVEVRTAHGLLLIAIS